MKKIFILLLVTAALSAQDFGFGFGDDYDTGGSFSKSAPAVTIGGEISASVIGYFKDFSDGADHVRLGDIFSGKLKFSAGNSFADAVINLNLKTAAQPVSIDEAFIRAFFGSFEIEAGLRKLTWGKADSFGPLDVINPLDYSEMTDLTDMMNLKIARPLVHVSYRAGSFSKIEGVFVPWFEPLRFAEKGRWEPAQMKELNELAALVYEQTGGYFTVNVHKPVINAFDTLKYAQAGARFTTAAGSADIGFQYYYGRLMKPAVFMSVVNMPEPLPTDVYFKYNPYHQIGADFAKVLFGFNVRAELAFNITGDLKGDDGSVYNPSLLWSFGFDRDLFSGINFNFQLNESIRMANSKVGSNPMLDTEANSKAASTQVIAALSKKFLRDELEIRTAFLWGIEDKDFFLMPSITWTRDGVSIVLSLGIFGGDKKGQFGQYRGNNFIKAALAYSF